MINPNLKKILEEIKKAFPENHKDIYLYGFQSRGEAKENSEIDILVFSKYINKKNKGRIRKIV